MNKTIIYRDGALERVIKEHGSNQAIYVNSALNGCVTQTGRYTVYPNAYYSYGDDGRYTKHIYIGLERVLSQVGGVYGEPRILDVAGHDVRIKVDYPQIRASQDSVMEAAYSHFDLPYNGTDHDNFGRYKFDLPGYWNGSLQTPRDSEEDGDEGTPARAQELLYYYHTDHLGSSTLITDGNGQLVQQIEYLPYGEVFLEKQASGSTYATPYKFNGKELDEETGLYYYGARYMNPRLSIWYGCDPMQEKYPSISSYAYCAGNPVKFADMFGLEIDENSRNEWNMKVCEIQIELKRLTEDNCKKPSHEVANRIDYLNDLLYGLKYLEEESLTVYELNPTSSAIGLTQYNPENGHIVLSYNNTSNFVHEVVHGIQFELGDIIFGLKNDENGLRNAILIDVFDEIGAYRFQYAYNPSSISDLSQIKINNLSDINKRWLNSIKEDGQYIYNPNYNDRIGIRSIGIENIKDFYKAYPRLSEQIPNLKIDLRDYLFKFPHN